MKTLDDINREIQSLMKRGLNSTSKRERSQCADRVGYLKTIKLYLETNPTPEFIHQQLSETVFKINKIEHDADVWMASKAGNMSMIRAAYFKTTQINRLMEYRKTLEFIVDNAPIGLNATDH